MQNLENKPLQDFEVAQLVRFIRREEDNEHVAQLCADISSEFSRIARYVGKVGFSLSDEWKSSDHLVLIVKDYKTRLSAIHIRDTGNHDKQSVDVSQAVLRGREKGRISFELPKQFNEAKNHVLAYLLASFPEDRLIAMRTREEVIPLFELPTIILPLPCDEGEVKRLAVEAANQEGNDAPMIKSPFADDNGRVRSFSR